MKKVNWGILSTAKIGIEKVIPAMQAGKLTNVRAIASRNKTQADEAAARLGIQKSHSSYEALLEDPEIEAIYIPLPNNMHVPWTIKALEAGKHVLCEKPIGLSAAEVQSLIEVSKKFPQLKVMEAFMYRFHPSWQHVKKLVNDGVLGEIRTLQAFFSYFNNDPNNIRNKTEAGGGGLMDIGCYCISQSRYIFGKEPVRVQAIVENDKVMGIDTLASAILDFGDSTSTFTCSTRLSHFQNFRIFGTKAMIDVEIPVNIPPDKTCRVWLDTNGRREELTFEPQNQYTLQGDIFSKAILENSEPPAPLSDALNNMKVIEAIKKSGTVGGWVDIS